MLDRLKFHMEEQSLTAVVAVKNRQVHFACFHGEAPEKIAWRVLENGRRFLRHLERVRITAWKKRYAAETDEERVSPWELSFIVDGVKRRITGDAYPENWPSFVDVMNELPGVAIPKIHQVETLSIVYEGALAPVAGNAYAPRLAGGTLVEKLAIHRGKHILILTRHKQGFGTERHAFDSIRNIPILLKRVDPSLTELTALAEKQAAVGKRAQVDEESAEPQEHIAIKFVRRTGEESSLAFGPRSTWPDCLKSLLAEISILTYDVKSVLLQGKEDAE
ncbi:hypothetical protein [Selenomonas sp.]|uniref:hypothetical protein n=1 Tax=Selenomonas sp. TaxID=2053611 RepID=UPI0025D36B7A|nr:hypothetical protein [Selenomonas sp.]MCI6283188.1 hypothetical protein [Selenomonas sp.]